MVEIKVRDYRELNPGCVFQPGFVSHPRLCISSQDVVLIPDHHQINSTQIAILH